MNSTLLTLLWLVRLGVRAATLQASLLMAAHAAIRISSILFPLFLISAVTTRFADAGASGLSLPIFATDLLTSLSGFDAGVWLKSNSHILTVVFFAIYIAARFMESACAFSLGMKAELYLKTLLLDSKALHLGSPDRLFSERMFCRAWINTIVKTRGLGRLTKIAFRLIPDIIIFTLLSIGLYFYSSLIFLLVAAVSVVVIAPLYRFQNMRVLANEKMFVGANSKYKAGLKALINQRVKQGTFDAGSKIGQDASLAAKTYYAREFVLGQSELLFGLLMGVILFFGMFELQRLDNLNVDDVATLIYFVLVVRIWFLTVQSISLGLGGIHKIQFHVQPVLDSLTEMSGRATSPTLVKRGVVPETTSQAALGPMRLNSFTAIYYVTALESYLGEQLEGYAVDEASQVLSFQRAGGERTALSLKLSEDLDSLSGISFVFDEEGCLDKERWADKYPDIQQYNSHLSKAEKKEFQSLDSDLPE